MKFGGSSLASAEKIERLPEFLENGQRHIIVLSAVGGMTDTLEALLKSDSSVERRSIINEINQRFSEIAINLLYGQSLADTLDKIKIETEDLNMMLMNPSVKYAEVISKGELLTTFIAEQYFQLKGYNSEFLYAPDFLSLDNESLPDLNELSQSLSTHIDNSSAEIFITQGFICRDQHDELSTLGRGGSDYSASLFAAALEVDRVMIWTDIDGMHNNDPRYVEGTHSIEFLSFDEAAELAYFGAKIMHPASIEPARRANIPVIIKNTFDPEARGTTISTGTGQEKFKAIAAKDNITAISIRSSRMLNAYGFLSRIFEIFERNQCPVDLITTSEVAISLTIDNEDSLTDILRELREFSTVEINRHQSILCIVGDFMAESYGRVLPVLQSLQEVPIRMISYGGSSNNISFVVESSQKVKALNLLQHSLFQNQINNYA